MKELDYKDAPDIGGGIVTGPDGGCAPDLGYPNWPLAPDPFAEVDPHKIPSDTDGR